MRIELVDNISRKLVDVILPAIEQSQECRIAVAFVSAGGFSLVEPAFRQCLQKGGYAEFLVGLDLSATDPQALWTLYQISQTEPNMACYCFSELGISAVYHPKLYVMKASDMATILVGSSNLTEGGLRENVEVNALILAEPGEEIVSDTYAVYNSLKFHPRRVEPDQEFLSLYEEMHSLRRRHDGAIGRNSCFRQLKSRFQEKAASLHRPVLTTGDLFGWQKLVFERLPDGQFKTRDIYQFEEEFRNCYPENRNIRAKIRQVLQQLRDLKILRHVARETWIKEVNITE